MMIFKTTIVGRVENSFPTISPYLCLLSLKILGIYQLQGDHNHGKSTCKVLCGYYGKYHFEDFQKNLCRFLVNPPPPM